MEKLVDFHTPGSPWYVYRPDFRPQVGRWAAAFHQPPQSTHSLQIASAVGPSAFNGRNKNR